MIAIVLGAVGARYREQMDVINVIACGLTAAPLCLMGPLAACPGDQTLRCFPSFFENLPPSPFVDCSEAAISPEQTLLNNWQASRGSPKHQQSKKLYWK